MIVRELMALLSFEVDASSLEKVEEAFQTIANRAFELDIAMQKIGNIGSMAMQELSYAALQTGIPIKELETRMFYLGRAVNETIRGGGGGAFSQLRISAFQLKEIMTQQGEKGLLTVLGMVADRFNKLDVAARNAVSVRLFSRAAQEMVPLLSMGSAGIAQLGATLIRTGNYMTEEWIKNGEKLFHMFIEIRETLKGFVTQAIGPLLPLVIQLTGQITQWLQARQQFIALGLGQALRGALTIVQAIFNLIEKYPAMMLAIGAAVMTFLNPAIGILSTVLLLLQDLNSFLQYGNKDSFAYLFYLLYLKLKEWGSELWTNFTKAFPNLTTKINEFINDPNLDKFFNLFIFMWDQAKIKMNSFFDDLDKRFAPYKVLAAAIGGGLVAGPVGALAAAGTASATTGYAPFAETTRGWAQSINNTLNPHFHFHGPIGDVQKTVQDWQKAMDDWWQTRVAPMFAH